MNMLGAAAYSASRVLHRSGVTSVYRRCFPLTGAVILVYHEVVGSVFEKHVTYLLANYNVVPLDDIVDAKLRGDSMPRNAVAITFDDGYRSLYSEAWPVMQKHNMPATAYLITDPVGKCDEFWFDTARELRKKSRRERNAVVPDNNRLGALEAAERDRLLARCAAKLGYCAAGRNVVSWQEVKEMASSGLLAVGSHTTSHPYLSAISAEYVEREIVNSKARLEAELSLETRHFCYPDGRFLPTHWSALRRAGYVSGVSTIAGVNSSADNIFALKRIGIGPRNSVDVLDAKVCGLWNLAYRSIPFVTRRPSQLRE